MADFVARICAIWSTPKWGCAPRPKRKGTATAHKSEIGQFYLFDALGKQMAVHLRGSTRKPWKGSSNAEQAKRQGGFI